MFRRTDGFSFSDYLTYLRHSHDSHDQTLFNVVWLFTFSAPSCLQYVQRAQKRLLALRKAINILVLLLRNKIRMAGHVARLGQMKNKSQWNILLEFRKEWKLSRTTSRWQQSIKTNLLEWGFEDRIGFRWLWLGGGRYNFYIQQLTVRFHTNIHFNAPILMIPTPGQRDYMKTFSTEFYRDRSRNIEGEGRNWLTPSNKCECHSPNFSGTMSCSTIFFFLAKIPSQIS